MFADMTSNFLASRAGPLSDLVNLHNLQLHCKRFVHLSASDDVSQRVIFRPNISSLLRAVSTFRSTENTQYPQYPVWASFSFISVHPLSFYAQETNFNCVHYILSALSPNIDFVREMICLWIFWVAPDIRHSTVWSLFHQKLSQTLTLLFYS